MTNADEVDRVPTPSVAPPSLDVEPSWFIYAAGPLIVWTIYWLAFFPGVISADSLHQWGEILSGRYDDWHPVLHTWLLWLLTRPGHSFGTVSVVQVVLTATLYGHIFAAARRLKTPGWLVSAMVAWLVISPVFGRNVIAVWKDGAFGIAILWVTLLMIRIVERGDLTPRNGALLGLALSLVWLLRHNGPALVLPTLFALGWYCWPLGWRGVVRAPLVCGGIVAFASALYGVAHIARVPPALKHQSLIHQVAGLVAAGTPLTDRERQELTPLLPLSSLPFIYHCRYIKPKLLNHVRHPRLLVSVWARLVARNPRAFVHQWACVTRYLWHPRSEVAIGPMSLDGAWVEPNDYGLATTSLLPAVQRFGSSVMVATFDPRSRLRPFIWQPAIPLYVLLGSLLVALWRTRSAVPLLLLLPAICNTGVWLTVSVGPHLRFQWPVILLAPVAVCLAGARLCETKLRA